MSHWGFYYHFLFVNDQRLSASSLNIDIVRDINLTTTTTIHIIQLVPPVTLRHGPHSHAPGRPPPHQTPRARRTPWGLSSLRTQTPSVARAAGFACLFERPESLGSVILTCQGRSVHFAQAGCITYRCMHIKYLHRTKVFSLAT